MTSSKHDFRKMTKDEVYGLHPEDKLHFLKTLQVKHANLERIAAETIDLLSPGNLAKIVAVVGPTTAGKSTMARDLIPTKLDSARAGEAGNEGGIGYLYADFAANGDRSLSWKSLYMDLLTLGNDIMIPNKYAIVKKDSPEPSFYRSHREVWKLRQSVESMLINRKIKALAIDEAYHLSRFGNYPAVMDTIKSLTDRTGTKILLLGSYQLIDLITQYGQVASRGEIVHFERYRPKSKVDEAEFKKIVSKFQQHWPCKDTPQFENVSSELMEVSLGCMGLLKSVLCNALQQQLKNGEKWDPKFMAKAPKSMAQLDVIRIEIEQGEERLKSAARGQTLFRGSLLERVAEKMAKEPANV